MSELFLLTDGENTLTMEIEGTEAFIIDPETDEFIDYLNFEGYLHISNEYSLAEELAAYFGLDLLEEGQSTKSDEWVYYSDEDNQLERDFERLSEIACEDWYGGFNNLY